MATKYTRVSIVFTAVRKLTIGGGARIEIVFWPAEMLVTPKALQFRNQNLHKPLGYESVPLSVAVWDKSRFRVPISHS